MSPQLREINSFRPAPGPERRSTSRFPLAEEVRYRVLDHWGNELDGVGVTQDMGRSGIRFRASACLPVGRLMEVSVNWPVALHGTCPLQFVAVGHVVRSSGTTVVLKIERYQFKTRGRALARTA